MNQFIPKNNEFKFHWYNIFKILKGLYIYIYIYIFIFIFMLPRGGGEGGSAVCNMKIVH
jgi:hypothetical protein